MSQLSVIASQVQNRLIDTSAAFSADTNNIINKAMRKLQSIHNFAVMEKSTTINTTIATRVLGDMPADFKEFRGGNGWYIDQTGAAVKVFHRPTLEDVLAEYALTDATETGAPRVVLIVPIDFGGGAPEENGPTFEVQVWPYPDGNSGYTPDGGSAGEYPVTLPYWGYLADLANNSDQNWFTDNAEDFLVYAALAEGFFYIQDETRAQMYEDRAYGGMWREQGIIGGEANRVINLDKRRRMGATNTLIPRRDVFAPRDQLRLS